jgi:hypothetical protein
MLRLDKKYLNFKNLLDTEIRTDSLIIENSSDEPVSVEITSLKPYYSSEIKPDTLEPGERGVILVTYDGTKRDEYGNVVDRADLYYKQKDKQSKGTLTIAANLIEDFTKHGPEFTDDPPVIAFDDLIINIGELQVGDSRNVVFEFTNKGGHDLLIRDLKVTHGAEIRSFSRIIKPENKGTIIVSVKGTIPTNNYQKNITVICNDPKKSNIQLRVRGKVVKK